MILDDREHDATEDEDSGAGLADEIDDDDEWMGGLCRAGLPVRQQPAPRPAGRGLRRPSERVQNLVAKTWSDSTRDCYTADWTDFAIWCSVHDLDDPYTADELDVAEWIGAMVDERLAMATIRRRMAAVSWWFDAAGILSPARGGSVSRVLAGAANTLGTGQRRVEPVRLDQLRRLVIGLPIVTGRPAAHSLRVRRDQVLFLIGWSAALRSAELVGLDVDDVTFTGDPATGGDGGMLIRIRTSKGDQNKPVHVAVPYSTHPSTCPVRLTMLYTRQVRTGPLFRNIDRHQRTLQRLRPTAVTRILKDHITEVLRENPDVYSSHSLRAGFVTEARAQRVPDPLIARHTRHRDLKMLNVYDRPTDLFNDPALAGEWW